MRTKLFLSIALLTLLSACSWVELNTEGKKVRVLSEQEVSSCKHIGSTTANVKDEVIGLERKPHIVEENLEILARNAAAEMGGDTVVAASPVKDGSRKFKVYKCVGQ